MTRPSTQTHTTMTITDQLLKRKFKPMLIGGVIVFGKRIGERNGERNIDRSLRVSLNGDKAFIQIVQRVNGVVTEVSARSVSISPTEAITCFMRVDYYEQEGRKTWEPVTET